MNVTVCLSFVRPVKLKHLSLEAAPVCMSINARCQVQRDKYKNWHHIYNYDHRSTTGILQACIESGPGSNLSWAEKS